MKYTVVCVGKLKERFWKDACAEYTKRLGAYAKVDIREVADIDPVSYTHLDVYKRQFMLCLRFRRNSGKRSSELGRGVDDGQGIYGCQWSGCNG